MSVPCSIDATDETRTSMGRLLNHSRSNANVEVKLIESDDGTPYLSMFAMCNISAGTELVYDYGERSSSALETFHWLKD